MPSLNAVIPANSPFTLQALIGALDWAVTAGRVTNDSPTSFTLTGSFNGASARFTVHGNSFGYVTVDGVKYADTGTITQVDMALDGVSQGRITGAVSLSQLAPIVRSDLDGSSPLAIEKFFLGFDWNYQGGNGADIARNGLVVGDGAAFNMRGDDTLRMGGGNDDIYSGNGDDEVYGEAGNDRLDGGVGSDLLNGGVGADRMTGGTGNDTYYVDNSGDSIVETSGQGTDTVRSALSFSLDGKALENLTLVGSVSIDGTGNAANNIIEGNAGANRLHGVDGNDRLYGQGGADRLLGGNGNDILDGGTGADGMAGGAGDDTYYVDNADDSIIEESGQGTDTIRSIRSFSLTNPALENLALSGAGAINGIGNAGANTIGGNSATNTLSGLAGNDRLSGGDGNDVLIGGTGDDRMTGGAGNDTYYVDNAGDSVVEANGQGTDTVRSTLSFSLDGKALENLTLVGAGSVDGTGSAVDNTVDGNVGANRLAGLGGNDRLYGQGGADRLLGGDGNDILDGGAGADGMAGGAGDDTYYVDNAGDYIVETTGQGTDIVRSSLSFKLTSPALENLTLSGAGSVNGTGNSGANAMAGNSGGNVLAGLDGNDTLNGGAGNDRLLGGDGYDIITGGSGIDRLEGGGGDDDYYVSSGDTVVETANAGDDWVYSTVDFALSQNVERLILTGTAAVDATGNSAANFLIGNSGANVMKGLAGDDALFGDAGNDTLSGGAGLDTFVFDTPLGGGNVDTILDFSAADDRLFLSKDIFSAIASGTLSAVAFSANATGLAESFFDRIIYETDTGELYYDSDGIGSTPGVLFAKLAGAPEISNVDIYIA